MRVLLVVNAAASSVTARRQVVIHRLIRADHDVDMVETSRRGHATHLALDAAGRGFDVVMVLGGDGTLNEVANGLVGSDCALAALPGGSTNVFARTLGLSDDPVEAAIVNLEAMAAGTIRPVGLGSVNGRYFLFHTGVGWDARLVRQVERHGELKRYASHPLFIWSGIRTWFRLYDRTRPHFRVRYGEETVENGYFTVVLNTNPYTYVGSRPFDLSPHASLDRPFAVVTITRMDTAPFLRLMFDTLRSSDATQRSVIVDYRADVSSLRIEAFDTVPFQVDGDDLGDGTTFDFQHHPDAIRLVLPATASFG